jgi:UDP-galactopyranose mutase
VIIKEFSSKRGEAYYPIMSEKNKKILKEYEKKIIELKNKNIYFIGRLAEYKYIDMDQACQNALNLFNKLEDEK